jgi:hypothetical protein
MMMSEDERYSLRRRIEGLTLQRDKLKTSNGVYEKHIQKLHKEKQSLALQINQLTERNKNQAVLVKRLESCRQEDRKTFNLQLDKLKEALSKARIKMIKGLDSPPNFGNNNNLVVLATPSPHKTPIKLSPAQKKIADKHIRQVTKGERNSWKQGVLTDGQGYQLAEAEYGTPEASSVQGAFLAAAIKKKEESQRGGFWDFIFGGGGESEEGNKTDLISKEAQVSEVSGLTKDVMQALEENKRLIAEHEEGLRFKENVQRVREEVLESPTIDVNRRRSSSWGLLGRIIIDGESDFEEEEQKTKRATRPEDITMDNIQFIRDSEELDVSTLKRLIATRTSTMGNINEVIAERNSEEGNESDFLTDSGDEF